MAEQFLESTASQLTYHGLCELTAAVKEGELSVFFRNNHFSTMIKHKVRLRPLPQLPSSRWTPPPPTLAGNDCPLSPLPRATSTCW